MRKSNSIAGALFLDSDQGPEEEEERADQHLAHQVQPSEQGQDSPAL